MRITTEFEDCIVCFNNAVGDWEHVIPESIGGRLEAKLICNDCNHKFGAELVSHLNLDPAIRYAYEHLKGRLPSLYNAAQQKATFAGKAEDGSIIRMSNAKGNPKILAGRGAGNSLILDTRDAKHALAKKLRRAKLSADQIGEYQSQFEQMAENEPLKLPTGDIFLKRPLPKLFVEIGNVSVDDRLLSLIAYEYFSLLIGDNVLREYFDSIRRHIMNGTETEILTISRLRGGEYAPYHVLDIDATPDSTTIRIRIFRWVVFSVTFNGLVYAGPDAVYLEDLETGKSMIAPTKSDAQQGNYYVQV
jgi:hypothetical protein